MYAVIKIRGSNHTEVGIKKALDELRLNRVNHLVIVPETEIGQIKKAKDYITWGEIDKEHLIMLLKEKGRLIGEKKLDDETVKELGFEGLEEMAEKILNGEIRIKDIPKMKPIFRMNPPRKGYKTTKKTYQFNGSIGYRGKDINVLIDRMIEGGKIGETEN